MGHFEFKLARQSKLNFHLNGKFVSNFTIYVKQIHMVLRILLQVTL